MEPNPTTSEECPSNRILTQLDVHVIGRASFRNPKRKADIQNLLFVQPHLSKSHAELRWALDKLYVVDTGLSLGTMVNNKFIVRGRHAEVAEGDILRFAIHKPIKDLEALEKTAISNGEATLRLDNVRTNFQIRIDKIVPDEKLIKVSSYSFPKGTTSPSLECLSTQTGDDLGKLHENTIQPSSSDCVQLSGPIYKSLHGRGTSFDLSASDETGSLTNINNVNSKYSKLLTEISVNWQNKNDIFDTDEIKRYTDSLLWVLDRFSSTEEPHTISSSKKPSASLVSSPNERSLSLPELTSKSSSGLCELDVKAPDSTDVDTVEIIDVVGAENDAESEVLVQIFSPVSVDGSASTYGDNSSEEDSEVDELAPAQLHLIYDDTLSDNNDAESYIPESDGCNENVLSHTMFPNEDYLPDWSSLDLPTTLDSEDDTEDEYAPNFSKIEKDESRKPMLVDSFRTSTSTRKRKASELDNDLPAETQPPKKVARLGIFKFALIAIKGFELCLFGFLALAAYGSYLENRFEYVDNIPDYGAES